MTAEIIDGKVLSTFYRQQVKDKVDNFLKSHSITLSLHVILVGHHTASQIYVKNKQKACQEIGILSHLHQLPDNISESQLINKIKELNGDKEVHGILLQLPLPAHLNSQKILEYINPLKDVDGLHPYNLGRLLAGIPQLVPCTPLGCMQLIESVEPKLEGKHAVVVGRSVLVGKPLATLLTYKNCTVTLAHSHTQYLKEICKSADILVCAIGKAEFITDDFIKPDSIVIDVGINRIQQDGIDILKGDVHFDSVKHVAGYITPVPGGVGPMTITNLLSNTVKAAEYQVLTAR